MNLLKIIDLVNNVMMETRLTKEVFMDTLAYVYFFVVPVIPLYHLTLTNLTYSHLSHPINSLL